MNDPDRPLRLDAPLEEALEHAAKLVAEAWRSFDRPRPEEPPLDEGLRALLQAGLPQEPVSVHEALDDAARALDESIAQPRPRYFAFIGSSGLEIGALGDLLASTYDMNLAVDARAATMIEHARGLGPARAPPVWVDCEPPCTRLPRCTTRSPERWNCSGSGATGSATFRSTTSTGCARTSWPRRSTVT